MTAPEVGAYSVPSFMSIIRRIFWCCISWENGWDDFYPMGIFDNFRA